MSEWKEKNMHEMMQLVTSPGTRIVPGPSSDEGQVQHPTEEREAPLLVVTVDDGEDPISRGQRACK